MYNYPLHNETIYNLVLQESHFHLLLDGSYQVHPYPTNRFLLIGRDDDGNQITGAAAEDSEIALVGERLDIKLQPMLSTGELATQAAAATLAKARLSSRAGFVTLPPNCGVQLWDVITIYDELCSQQGKSYRVIGIRLSYDPRQRLYLQHFLLSAV